MMHERCAHDQSHLTAQNAELSLLQRRRLRGHLKNCAPCLLTHQRWHQAIDEAQSWRPVLDPVRLEKLNGRLEAEVHAARNTRRALFGTRMMAVTAMLGVMVLTIWWLQTDRAPQLPTNNMPSSQTIAAMQPKVPTVVTPTNTSQRAMPTPFLRSIFETDWDGHFEVDGQHVAVAMSRGFAAFSFVGGSGRRLRISSPDALIDVVGTRLFVEVKEGATWVGVAAGKVRALTRFGAQVITAGNAIRIDASGVKRVDAMVKKIHNVLGSPYLAAFEHRVAHKRPKTEATKVTSVDVAQHILTTLDRAEALTRAGQHHEAIALYRAMAQDPRPMFQSYRPVCLYEIARIQAFALGNTYEGAQLLRRLRHSDHQEVSRQAALALCELHLNGDNKAHGNRCAAAHCLKQLARGAADFETRRDATALAKRWKLEETHCD